MISLPVTLFMARGLPLPRFLEFSLGKISQSLVSAQIISEEEDLDKWVLGNWP